jgi:hypothetical protein
LTVFVGQSFFPALVGTNHISIFKDLAEHKGAQIT